MKTYKESLFLARMAIENRSSILSSSIKCLPAIFPLFGSFPFLFGILICFLSRILNYTPLLSPFSLFVPFSPALVRQSHVFNVNNLQHRQVPNSPLRHHPPAGAILSLPSWKARDPRMDISASVLNYPHCREWDGIVREERFHVDWRLDRG
jgi:hypothetical protein